MPDQLENIKLGACTVTWDSTDLGYTKGGAEVELSTSKKAVTVDQFGESVVNEYITGRMIKVRFSLAEHDLAKLVNVIPGATLVTDGTDSSKKKITVTSSTGLSLRDIARKLVLHPKDLDHKNEDFVAPLAAPDGNITFSYQHSEERVFSVEFTGYPDATTGELYTLGDDTATA